MVSTIIPVIYVWLVAIMLEHLSAVTYLVWVAI